MVLRGAVASALASTAAAEAVHAAFALDVISVAEFLDSLSSQK